MIDISCPRVASRRGITLLEVLISIGILAIGLTSVLGLMAAARTQAARAVVLDRAALMANNVLADAATFGLLRSGTDCFCVWRVVATGSQQVGGIWMTSGTTWRWQVPQERPSQPLVFDAFTGGDPITTNTAGLSLPTLEQPPWTDATPGSHQKCVLQGGRNARFWPGGIYGGPQYMQDGAAKENLERFLQSRDDLAYVKPQSPDDPPLNLVAGGRRVFEGAMTALLCVSGTGLGPYQAAAVVFHKREAHFVGGPGGRRTAVLCTLTSGTLQVGSLVRGAFESTTGVRSLESILRPGTIVWVPNPPPGSFHQLTSVSATVTGGTPASPIARVVLSTDKVPVLGSGTVPMTIQLLPDSVGYAERWFMPEAPGVFTQ